jgi:hypothetical protein
VKGFEGRNTNKRPRKKKNKLRSTVSVKLILGGGMMNMAVGRSSPPLAVKLQPVIFHKLALVRRVDAHFHFHYV